MQIDSPRASRSRLVIETPNFEAVILAGGPVVARVSGRGALAAVELPVVSVAGPAELAALLTGLETILGALAGLGGPAIAAAALASALDS